MYNIQICFGDVKRGQLLIQTWLNIRKRKMAGWIPGRVACHFGIMYLQLYYIYYNIYIIIYIYIYYNIYIMCIYILCIYILYIYTHVSPDCYTNQQHYTNQKVLGWVYSDDKLTPVVLPTCFRLSPAQRNGFEVRLERHLVLQFNIGYEYGKKTSFNIGYEYG